MEHTNKERFLDRHLGTIICYFFSFINLFIPKKKVKKIRNVLIIELFEMGSAVMAYPSLKFVKNKIKNANIYCMCVDKVKYSWELSGLIPEENIFVLDSRNLFTFAISLIKQTNKLRKKDIDVVIDFELFTRISSIIAFLVKPKSRAGFHRYNMENLYRGSFYDVKCTFNQNMHISKNLLALTKTALSQVDNNPNHKDSIDTSEIVKPNYKSDPKIKSKLKKRIAQLYPKYRKNKLILVSTDVGQALPVRNYPKESFVKVITGLLSEYPDHLILLIGLPENLPVCTFVKTNVKSNRCINFCNHTHSIEEFVELCTFSELLISNDNGPPHFASMTDIKILTLFSAETPFMYGPLGNCVTLYTYYQCSPCVSAFNHKNTKCTDNKCIKTIAPELVIDYCKKMLSGKARYRTVNNEISYII